MTKPRRTLENRGKQENAAYDIVSDVLDFVPVVGGLNRFARGEYKEGLINLGLDALGPIKYIAKGAKGIRMLANAGKLGQNITKAKRYNKAWDKVATKLEEKAAKGTLTEKAQYRTADILRKMDAKAEKVERRTKQGVKTIVGSVAPGIVGKTITHNDTNFRIGLAAGVHDAMNAPDTKTAILQAIDGTFARFGDRSFDPGNAFLLGDKEQEKFMNRLGYFKTTDDDGIKMIGKSTQALKDFRGNDKINIYQLGEDVIPRDSVVPIPHSEVPVYLGEHNLEDLHLYNAGNHPVIYYKHKNPNKDEYYYREIDLNDYGNHNNSAGTTYGTIQDLANLYDKVGNPFIQKTGLQLMIDYPYKHETDERSKHKDGGSIHIDPSKRGTFRAAATKHGMSVQEYASRVLANKEDYSPAMVKKANFARNASKWH